MYYLGSDTRGPMREPVAQEFWSHDISVASFGRLFSIQCTRNCCTNDTHRGIKFFARNFHMLCLSI